jgi:3-oxoacyl-[acyl-carrier protein] reductase
MIPLAKSDSSRVVLITGAAGGLGTALVEAFHADGWCVVAGQHRKAVEMESERVLALPLDVTDAGSVASAVEQGLARWGRLDVLINNAGIARDGIVPTLDAEDWDRVLDVNLKGAFLCCREVLPRMVQKGRGHVVNIASYGGRVGRAGQSNYAASKAGLLGLTQSLAREYGLHQVQVNTVLPGFLRTPLVGELTEQQLAMHAGSNTLGRLNDLDEVARFVVFLVGMKNVSGQVFQLDSRLAPAL